MAATVTVSSMAYNNRWSSNGGGRRENANSEGGPSAEISAVGLRHNPGLSVEWTPEEQATLEELLSKYSSEPPLDRYAKISMSLRDKTIRDVALRCKWMDKNEHVKKRKDDDNSTRKNRGRKGKATNSTSGPSNVVLIDNGDGISAKAIGGPAGQLLKQNAQVLDLISANLAACKIQENLDLFRQAHTNIISILNNLNDEPETMKHMPPLLCNLNDELVRSVLGTHSLLNQR